MIENLFLDQSSSYWNRPVVKQLRYVFSSQIKIAFLVYPALMTAAFGVGLFAAYVNPQLLAPLPGSIPTLYQAPAPQVPPADIQAPIPPVDLKTPGETDKPLMEVFKLAPSDQKNAPLISDIYTKYNGIDRNYKIYSPSQIILKAKLDLYYYCYRAAFTLERSTKYELISSSNTNSTNKICPDANQIAFDSYYSKNIGIGALMSIYGVHR